MWLLILIGLLALFVVVFCGIMYFFAWIGSLILCVESYIIDRLLKKDDPELYSITTDWRNHDFAKARL